VQASVSLAYVILTEASLSYLGLILVGDDLWSVLDLWLRGR